MSIDRAKMAEITEKTLAPFIGASMARSSIKMHCEKLGINGDAVSDEQVSQLTEQLGMAMRVFVGSDKDILLAWGSFTQLEIVRG